MLEQSKIDVLRSKAVPAQHNFIDGQWIPAETEAVLEVVSPIDGAFLSTIADSSAGDIDRAVKSARMSFDRGDWSRAAPTFRKKVLLRLAELIEQHSLELAVLGVRDNGTEIAMAVHAEPGSAAGTFRYYAEAIDKVYGEVAPTADNILGLIHREPVGVVGVIVPWNFPLMIGAWKLAPALAAGNSVVLKPAEGASLSLLRLAELAAEAGLPDGVLNVVTGRGSVSGEALGLHGDVDVLAFTGSGNVGRRLLEYSARSNLKRVYLELGGKSPNIVFADAPNLDLAAKMAAFAIFRNSGQVCVSGSRLLVEEKIHDEFVEKLMAVTQTMKVGDPLDLESNIGAVASKDQLEKNLHHVHKAENEGAKRLIGGNQLLEATGGFYMAPTIFDEVSQEMSLFRDEVFGPVLAVSTFQGSDEAARIANNTDYGLASAVWTSNLSTAHKMVRKIRAGVVHVNCYGGADITVPLGGVKQSGNGHDRSIHALNKYFDLKTAWISID